MNQMLRDHMEMNAKSVFRRVCQQRGVELRLNDKEVIGCFGPDCAASSGRMGDHPCIMMAPLETYSSVNWAILCFWHEMGHLTLNESAFKKEYEYERVLDKQCPWVMEYSAWGEALLDAYQHNGVMLTPDLAKKIQNCLTTYSKKWHNFYYKDNAGYGGYGDGLLHEDGDNVEEEEPMPPAATEEQVNSGQAKWCWACGIEKCRCKGADILVMCDKFKMGSGDEKKE